jgi:phosphoglycerate dehydrogenase-like enzyme
VTRVAVTSRSFSRHPILRAELLARFPEARFNDDGVTLRGDALVEFLRDAEGAIVGLEPVDDALLDAVPQLRVVSKVGVGLDSIDTDALRRHGVTLGWTGGTNSRSVAELVLAFAIALLRRLPAAQRDVLERNWRQTTGTTLTGKTVGIVGFGNVGREVAALLDAFGCRILAYDIGDDLKALLRDSDVVTLHLPLDASTRHVLNADRIAAMKRNAVLINTARGGLVDEAALHEALASGRLGGAALDVLEEEPPHDLALLALDNVIVTPHIGGSTEEAILAMGRAAIDGLG